MKSNLDEKRAIVEEIKEKISSSKATAFIDYKGLTVEEVTKIRKDFRDNGAFYKVYKNRLVLRALEELGFKDLKLEGTNAVACSFADEVTAPKLVSKAQDDTKKIEILFGIVNGKIADKQTIETLSKIPSREALISQLLSVLTGPARSLACTLKAVSEKN